MRVVLNALRYNADCELRRKALKKQADKMLHKRKMKAIFIGWRQVSHTWFKQRIDREEKTFTVDLESKMLLQWSTKVDEMLIYMAELEDKIKQEQMAREQLALEYEQSLN